MTLALLLSVTTVWLAGCDPALEQKYYKEGIGTEIARPDIATVTALQDLYLSELCRQTGMVPMVDGSCSPVGVTPNWGVVVEAGMNDIDARCDAYLAWLDDKRRTQEPILSEINALQTTSQALMRVAGVGADPITMVGLAFGLASNTFTNIRSRLLLEANHSTVQSIVLSRQKEYRDGLMKQRVVTRAEAVYALRSYLRICMPMTIEMQINTTIAIYEQAGVAGIAIKRDNPLIDPRTVTRNAPVAAITSGQKIVHIDRPVPGPIPGLADIAAKENPELRGQSDLNQLQSALCAQADNGAVGALTKAEIGIFKIATYVLPGDARREGKQLSPDEIRKLKTSGECPDTAMNYYEKVYYKPNAQAKFGALGSNLDRFIPENPVGTPTALTKPVREKIALARQKLGKTVSLRDYGINVSDQLTRDFDEALAAAVAPPAPAQTPAPAPAQTPAPTPGQTR
ncbi:hypothetical protein XI09_38805 [Bradyrhizobium sp. CCBAU 11386]|nr:hypothetical protein [Bradyrhizobium sp. CCBAU 11386]